MLGELVLNIPTTLQYSNQITKEVILTVPPSKLMCISSYSKLIKKNNFNKITCVSTF